MHINIFHIYPVKFVKNFVHIFFYIFMNIFYSCRIRKFPAFCIIRKLINIESKINNMYGKQKLILQKASIGTFEITDERENIDIFQDLPLKNSQDIETMETKLKNDLSYKNQMVS